MHKPLGSFAQFLLESEQTSFSYGCVMACMDFPPLIKNIHDGIDDEDIAHEAGGLEDNTHVTILYGLHDGVKPDAVKSCISEIQKVKLKGLSVFECKDFDVLKFDVEAPGLIESNAKLRDTVPYTNKFTDYKPHVTVAYLKAGTGSKYASMWARQMMPTLPVTKIIYTTSGESRGKGKSRQTFKIA